MKLALAVLILALAGCDTGDALQRMIRQEKTRAFGEEPAFADGAAMQRPPEGALAQEALHEDVAREEGFTGREFVREIPLPVTPSLLERGRERFQIFCAPCHGALGDGRTLIASRMKLRPPRSLHDAEVKAMPAGRLYDIVRRGYGLMPSYSDQLAADDRWAVVAYVQALELSQEVPLDALPAPLRAEALAALGSAVR